MIRDLECEYCKNNFPINLDRCPHCARPGLFPNVQMAKQSDEVDALETRYQMTIDEAKTRNCEDTLTKFETDVAQKSKAVICRSLVETIRMSNSDRELYSTYYLLEQSESKIPSGSKWDRIRPLAEEYLFPHSKEYIRFGALSLNEQGLKNYGECSWVLKTDMIEHRTSVFEENCVIFVQRHGIDLKNETIPKGYRASWGERGKIAAAKLLDNIQTDTLPEMYPEILLQNSPNSEEDNFIETHTWGPISLKAIEKITTDKPLKAAKKVLLKALRKRLLQYDVTLEVI